MIEGEQPAEYMIVKNEDGKEVYKRRVMNKERVRKSRPEGYYEEKQRALSARAKRLNSDQLEAKEKREKQYKNMFSNFAINYSSKLDSIVK